MKTSRFSEGQIAYILRQAEEGTAIAEFFDTAGINMINRSKVVDLAVIEPRPRQE